MTAHLQARLAPSPTGSQHLGNARTYLIAWLSARSSGGSIVLRIEDIDTARNKPYATQEALDDLRWLGIDWDDEVVIQSSRLPEHRAALEQLKQAEWVYPCTCSRNDIANAASAPHVEHEAPTYPGTCSIRTSADASLLTKPYAWRFRAKHTPEFHDRFLGLQRLDLQKLGGDFVVWRSANVPAYQLAVVVDDAAAGVTEVVRGDDLLTSTPRQILIYQALGLKVPQFAHVPLVIGTDGHRLAKRHGDIRLSAIRAAGISSDSVIGLLAWSCGWIPEVQPISARELLKLFNWNTIPKQPFVLGNPELERIGYRVESGS